MATKMTDVPDAEALLSEDQQRWLNTYPRRAWPTVMLALAQNHAIALRELAAERLARQQAEALVQEMWTGLREARADTAATEAYDVKIKAPLEAQIAALREAGERHVASAVATIKDFIRQIEDGTAAPGCLAWEYGKDFWADHAAAAEAHDATVREPLEAQIAALVTLIGDVADQQAMPDDSWKTALTAIRQGQP